MYIAVYYFNFTIKYNVVHIYASVLRVFKSKLIKTVENLWVLRKYIFEQWYNIGLRCIFYENVRVLQLPFFTNHINFSYSLLEVWKFILVELSTNDHRYFNQYWPELESAISCNGNHNPDEFVFWAQFLQNPKLASLVTKCAARMTEKFWWKIVSGETVKKYSRIIS